MNNTVQVIPIPNLLLAFIPGLVVVAILYRWSLGARVALYGLTRMVVQLLLVGYVLAFVFQTKRAEVVVGVLAVMLFVSSWIALRPLARRSRGLYGRALAAISLGGIVTLVIVTQAVLRLHPWFWPQYMIPLAGMIFANAMNAVSLAAERFESETAEAGCDWTRCRGIALRAALIPTINSLFAVGLVALPGMMTGQILSGVSPLVAARYQIMVMSMIFGSAGIAAACYLMLTKTRVEGSDT